MLMPSPNHGTIRLLCIAELITVQLLKHELAIHVNVHQVGRNKYTNNSSYFTTNNNILVKQILVVK